MRVDAILDQLQAMGSEKTRAVLLRHGVPESCLGVKIEDLKKIRKKVGKDHGLALDLYATGVYDAQYLAGLIADETMITKPQLRQWLKGARCDTLRRYVVAAVAAESKHGRDLALKWIDAKDPAAASTGWAVLSGLVAVTDDAELGLPQLEKLLQRVAKTIHDQPDPVRYAMNGFVIAVGCYVKPLTEQAVKAAKSIGKVSVDMGDTACKVPFAPDYIKKVQQHGTIGRKRKGVRCQ